jgi:hypothetical protein
MIQYGVLLHGAAGMSIPISIPLILVMGFWMVRYNTPNQAIQGSISTLKKYDYIFLFIAIFAIYNTYTLPYFSNDTIPAQLLPYFILHDHTIFLDQATAYLNQAEFSYRFVDVGGGHYASLFPIVTPILILPVYIIPISILNIPMTDYTLLSMGKICAALISSLACVFIYLTCKKLTTPNIALISSLIFAFATSTWSISSQVLWAHGVVELLLAGMLYLVVKNEKKESLINIVWLGVASGLFVFNRPSDAILLIPIVAYVFNFYKERLKFYLAFAFISGSPFLIYNLLLFGNPLGGYMPIASRLGFGAITIINYIGSLIAPNKGLLVFSPILILALLGFLITRNKKENKVYVVLQYFIPVIVANIAIYALFDDWIGGIAYGPRYLTGILPILGVYVCLTLNYLFVENSYSINKKIIIGCTIVFLIIVSVAIHFIGVFYYPAAIYSGSLSKSHYDPWSLENSIIAQSYFVGSNNITFLKKISFNESFQYKDIEVVEPGRKIIGVPQIF